MRDTKHLPVNIIVDKNYRGINPIVFGFADCPPHHFFGPGERAHWLIHYVASGKGVFSIHGKTHTLGAGELFVIPPFEEVYYESDTENPWSYIWIGFSSDIPLPIELPDVFSCPEAFEIFKDMKKCADMENGKSAFLLARLWDLFSLLLEPGQGQYDRYVKKALEIIHTEYMNELSVQMIADRIGLERTYFSVLFKRNIGVSPGQYLFDYRMTFAASLMVNHGENVTSAANAVGYPNIYNFSKMFKKRFGMSPKNYCESLKNR